MLNVADPHFSQYVDTHVRGNNAIHCVADPKVKEIKATNSFESYVRLTDDRE